VVNLSAALAETRLRLLNISRYPGQLTMDVLVPVVFAAMPMLLGRATAGPDAAANFQANTGTANYVAYLLIGSNAFTIVTAAFWHIAYWLRFEQETGTLEGVYLTPTPSTTLVAGVALYSAARGLSSSLLGYLLGCLVFRVNPFSGDVLLALAFLLVGLIPLYGLTFLFGAVVLKVKESNALINLMQWLVSFLMGIFYPVAVLPGVGYFFGEWYLDLAVLWAFLFAAPLFSLWVFRRVERGVKRNEGIGEF